MWNSSSKGGGGDSGECSPAFQRLSSERGSGRSGQNAAWDRSSRPGSGRGADRNSSSSTPSSMSPTSPLQQQQQPGLVPGHRVRPGDLPPLQQLPSPGGGRIPPMSVTSPPGAEDQEARRTNLKISFAQKPAARKAATEVPGLAAFAQKAGTPTEAVQKRERGKFLIYDSAHSAGKLKFDGQEHDFKAEDLTDLGEIGRGNFGTVNKMSFTKTGKVMAVKRIRSTVDEREQKELLMDLEVVMKSSDCRFIVTFFGAIFKEGDCWICMELMDSSFDQFYKLVYGRLGESIPEWIIGKVTVATVMALNYLKEQLKIIHRDVKPSNILVDRKGAIKLCDFGISGQLIDSIAKTRDAGCRPYMAPERINPQQLKGYDVRSDVWSLGITLFELATGKFPYPKWNSVFEQLHQVVDNDPPRLEARADPKRHEPFTLEFVNFVNTCLIKDEQQRPKYNSLLKQPFIKRSESENVNVSEYVGNVLDRFHAEFDDVDMQEV